MRVNRIDNFLRCSFCLKAQEEVGKLISNAGDSPRVYICDECVATCAFIIENERTEAQAAITQESGSAEENAPHPLLDHPLASELLDAIENWIRQESVGKDGALEFSHVRDIARRMLAGR